MNKPIYLLLLYLLAGCAEPTQPFSIKEFSSNFPYSSVWEGRAPTSEENGMLENALGQEYSYLGSGGQCIAFLSSDRKYVIKFFKQKKFAVSSWTEKFPFPSLISSIVKKQAKKGELRRNKMFSAFLLSHKELAEESGLIYLHLNRTNHLQKTICIIGPDKIPYEVKLDEIEFVLQKRAELAFETINRLASSGNTQEAKLAIDKLLNLHLKLYAKGIRNRDPNLRSNCGFIDGEPIIVDVGRIVKGTPKDFEREFARISVRLGNWLKASHPELLDHFEESVAKIISSER